MIPLDQISHISCASFIGQGRTPCTNFEESHRALRLHLDTRGLSHYLLRCMPLTHASSILLATGLMVIERNWLDVYPYTNWGGISNLPVFRPGDTFSPSELLLQSVRLLVSLSCECLFSQMRTSTLYSVLCLKGIWKMTSSYTSIHKQVWPAPSDCLVLCVRFAKPARL